MGHPRLYDLLGHFFWTGRKRRVYRQLAAKSGVRAGDRVLDVGCGTGYFTRIMAQAVGPDGRAQGVDPSQDALARSRQLTRSTNCTFAQGQAENLDIPTGSIDVVVTTMMIHHLPEQTRPQAITEMLRVLRPGGQVLLADFRPPTNPLLRRLIHPLVSPAMQHNPVNRLESILRDAGFKPVTTGDIQPWIHYATATKPT
jgi:ubiquinone/menaquinone biosynthesis C-methylase UbiE